MEINPLHKQAAALEAAQAEAASNPTGGQPLNLAGQVQKVFGPDTVVTDGSHIAIPVDGSRTADGQGSDTQSAGVIEPSAHLPQDGEIHMGTETAAS